MELRVSLDIDKVYVTNDRTKELELLISLMQKHNLDTHSHNCIMTDYQAELLAAQEELAAAYVQSLVMADRRANASHKVIKPIGLNEFGLNEL